jgi:hypothetical protein
MRAETDQSDGRRFVPRTIVDENNLEFLGKVFCQIVDALVQHDRQPALLVVGRDYHRQV